MVESDPRQELSPALGPAVAGTWYPSDADALEHQVDELTGAATARPAGASSDVAALIAPHAGYAYSGAVAGKGFHLVRGSARERVVLLGPSHYSAFEGACLPAAHAYRTPLGPVPLDTEAIEQIGRLPGMRIDDTPFVPEHCLEAEIPFLQRCLRPGWRMIPVLVGGGGSIADLRRIVDALAPQVSPDTLVVASSDFTHYGPRFGYVPFRDRVPERIRRLDMDAVERILRLDGEGFHDFVCDTGATICGRGPIGVLLGMTDRSVKAELVAYDTSGRMTGDWMHSVSYASIVFHH